MKCKFKTLSRFARRLGIFTLFSAPFFCNAQINSYIAPKSWYDVNEDGNFELISWDGVYSINSSNYICPGEFSSISNFYPGFCYGFADFDFDGKTDIYGNYESKYGNSAIWLNTTGFESVVPSGIRSQIIPIELYGDGRKYVVRSKSNFLTNGTDLSAMPFDSYLFGENNQLRYTPASIMTINQYNGLREELDLSKGGDGIPGWGDMFAHTTNDMWGGNFSYQQVDLNGDGMMDYVNSTGFALIYTGNGSYVTGNIAPNAKFRDLNGDGLTDYALIKDKNLYVYLVDPNGNNPQENIILKNISVSDFWIRDYNKDGHPDIIAIGGGDKEGFYLLVMENKGDGSFKKHENYIYGQFIPIDCIDYDWNGNLNLVGGDAPEGYTRNLVSYEIFADGSATNESVVVIPDLKIDYDNSVIFDPANNGSIAIFVSQPTRDSDGAYRYFKKLGNATNSKPLPPSKPEFNYDKTTGKLKINWEAGSDNESSSADLTYSLRIGTTPGGHDILNADATKNGNRLNITGGNNGYSRQRVLNTSTWGEGKYYISVQCIDPANRGSVFSDETVFVKDTPSSEFIISYKNELPGAGCEVYLETTAIPVAGSYLIWNLDDASILSSNNDLSRLIVKWEKGGEKNISLSVSSPSGNVSPLTHRKITIEMSNTVTGNLTNVSNDIDIDCDGNSEVIISGKINSADANGEYSPIKKIFNQNLNISNSITIDQNKDGYPDLLNTDNHQLIINVDGDDMEILDAPEKVSVNILADIDGDGYLEGMTSISNIVEFGQNFEKTGERSSGITSDIKSVPYKAIDYDRDGFTDIVALGNSSGNNKFLEFWKNNDNKFFSFEYALATGDNPVPGYYYHPTMALEDFNGDGKVDFIMSASSYAFGVTGYEEFLYLTYNGEEPMAVQCLDGKPFADIVGTCDLDNNGLPDVIVELSEANQYAVVYMLPGNKYVVSTLGDIGYHDILYHTADGKYRYGNLQLNMDNSKPTSPSAIRSAQIDNNVIIEWNHSIDKETPESNMRYNLSVKKKGASGEGAYIISPLNLSLNGVRPSSSQQLYNTNRVAISKSALIPGEYEVKVQGIDLMGTPSDFSEIYQMSITDNDWIEMPTTGFVGDEIEVAFKIDLSTPPDFGDDADVISVDGSKYTVSWGKEGLKNVSIEGVGNSSIFIYNHPNDSYSLPTEVLKDATVVCQSEDIPYLKIGISPDGGNTILDNDGILETLDIAMADESISFTFKKAGEWTVISTVERPGMPSYQFNSTTTVIEENSQPKIDYINRVDNKYKISWNIPIELQSNLTGISIFRKAPSSPSFIRIKTLPKDAEEYIDSNSDGNQESDGYAIRYELPYGYSKMSEVHIPTCLKLTTFDNLTGWNLTWNAHTGSEVDRYIILRGSTPDSLTEIASVDGCSLSYIDKNAPDGEWFYAVEVILASSQINKISRTLESRKNGILTNVISTHDALKVIPANGIEITNTDKALNYYATPEGIHLSATISPLNATIRKINWSVTDGSELASIDQNGRLISKTPGDGIVRVKAATTDGSELTTEININVTQEKPYIMRDPIINPEGIEHKCYSEFYEADRECNSYYCVGSTTCQGDVMTNIRIADSGRKIYIPARKFGIFPKSEDITLHDVWIEGLVENDTLYIPSWQIVDINENGKKLYLCAYDEDELLPYMTFTYSSTLNSDGSLDGISCWVPGGYVGRSFKLVTNGKIPQVESYHVHPHFIKTYYGTEATIPEEEDIISRDQYLFSYKQSGINHSRTVNAVVDKNGKVYIQGLFDIAPLAWIPFTVSSEGDGLKAVDWDWVDINNGYKYYRVGMSEKMMTDISKVLSYQPYFVFNHGMLEGIAKYPYFHCYTADEEYTYTNYSDVKLTKIGNHSYRSLPANILDASISTTDNLLLSQTSDLNPKLVFSIYVDNFSISDGSTYRNFRYSTDGRIYPVDNLGWKLYIDDTPIPFNQYYFPSLTRNLDWVGMNDEFSPYCTMHDYSQYQYWIPIKNGWQKVELVHTINFNGDISESDKTLVIDLSEAEVESSLSADTIVSTEYYNLEGVRITKPINGGVYLRRTIHQNGHISIEKIRTK